MIRFIRLAPLSSGEKVEAMFMPQCGNLLMPGRLDDKRTVK